MQTMELQQDESREKTENGMIKEESGARRGCQSIAADPSETLRM